MLRTLAQSDGLGPAARMHGGESGARVNTAAPINEPRRLLSAELTARGMDNFTKPSISQTIRLPGYEHSDQMAWPVVPPNDLAASYAALMRPSRDIRYTADWRQAAEADRLERLQIAECRAAEAEAAKVTSRTEYERTLIKNNRRNVNAAPTNGGVGSKQSSGAFLHVFPDPLFTFSQAELGFSDKGR